MLSFIEFLQESVKQATMYKDAKKQFDIEGLTKKVETSAFGGSKKIHLKNGYSVGVATEFHDMYTLYKKGKEIDNFKDLNDVFKKMGL